jgi:hypothetical protein
MKFSFTELHYRNSTCEEVSLICLKLKETYLANHLLKFKIYIQIPSYKPTKHLLMHSFNIHEDEFKEDDHTISNNKNI